MQRRAFDLDEIFDRHNFPMLRQIGQCWQRLSAIGASLSPTKYTATAHIDTGSADIAQRVQPVLIVPPGDDFTLKLGCGIKIVVTTI